MNTFTRAKPPAPPVLKQRIIAKLLVESVDGQHVAVKYKRFTESRRVVGDPISLMKTLEHQVLDEFYICFLGRVDCDFVERMATTAFCPVAVGGSINEMAQVHTLIRNCGVDKIVTRCSDLGYEAAERYGRQALAYPVDYRGAVGTPWIPEWAGELLLTSIDRDGTGTGMDLDALRGVYNIPVVLAGGCGKLKHVKDALAAGANGVCVSSMFAFTDKSPIKLRSWLVSEGCNVRQA